jgi:hypothetical protein
MTNQHPITPSLELVTSLRNSAPHGIRDAGVTRELWLINHAYAAGADQELEACLKALDAVWDDPANSTVEELQRAIRTARRPKLLSLKEQAIAALNEIQDHMLGPTNQEKLIRRALEALDD